MNYLERLRDIHTLIFDIDGVMTNNELIVLENGHLLRTVNVRDGYALKKAIKAGYRICVITGGKSSGMTKRLRALGIEDIFTDVQDKLPTLREYVHLNDLDPDGILYMGDDLPDYQVMRHVGVAACPKDAANEVLEIAHYISPFEGGKGCVRDIIERVMKIEGHWK